MDLTSQAGSINFSVSKTPATDNNNDVIIIV